MGRLGNRKQKKGRSVAPDDDLGHSEDGPGTVGKNGKKNMLSRKKMRQNIRKMQKAKKHEYFTSKKKKFTDAPAVVDSKAVKPPMVAQSEKKKPPAPRKDLSASTAALAEVKQRKRENMEREQQKNRIKQLIVANRDEDKNIRKIEKQLKLNKRKNKTTIPKSFVDDGLDYLLEVCDADKLAQLDRDQFDFADNEAGFEEDLALLKSESTVKDEDEALDDECSDDDDQIEDEEESEDEEDEGVEEEDDRGEEVQDENDDMDDSEDEVSEEEKDGETKTTSGLGEKDDGRWEDIYGRLRDKEGNVIRETRIAVPVCDSQTPTGRYVPPGKRQEAGDESADAAKLRRQMKGLFNRLAEANLPSIVSSIEELYRSYARHAMQQAINTLVLEALIGPVLSPERLVMEHCLLIAALHANVGTEVGAQFLEAVVRRFDGRYTAGDVVPDEDKELDNLLLVVAHLYNFGVVAASLLVDILHRLAERFTDKDIELVLIVLRSVGFALRKDDPLALKQVILSLQSQAASRQETGTQRTRFMLDILLAIRNNNVSKIPHYDPQHVEHLRKILRHGLIRKGLSLSKLNISYQDLLTSDQRGRWWVVGSAWTGQGPKPVEQAEPVAMASSSSGEPQFSAQLLELARKQRMNTDVRRNIFCVLMTADDYVEAVDRLLRLGLKPQQERELIHVAVDCCLHEKKYNPYYGHVALKLCLAQRNLAMAAQFALWDRFQDLARLTPVQTTHLAKLVVHLVVEQALSLAVLKVIQFTDMNRTMVRFLRHVLLGLLLHPSEAAVQATFQRISHQSKLSLLRGGLHLFMHHFVLSNADKMNEPAEADRLRQRVRVAEQALNL